MADSFIVAPSVQWTERDATLATTASLTQVASMVGEFAWGPAEQVVRISTGEDGLVANFWKPTKDFWLDFLVAADFFRYSKSAWLVRALKAGATNAVPTGASATLVKNSSELEDYAGDTEMFARYPGALGNNLNMFVMDSTLWATAKAEYTAGFRTGLAYLWALIEDKSALVVDETFNVFVFDDSGALSGSIATEWAGRKKLVVEWPAAEDNPGLYLGTQSGSSRILLQWTGTTPPANDAELAAALVAQFKLIPENIKRLNNIRNFALNGTEDFEVEFYTDPASATWYSSAVGVLGAGTAVTAIAVQTYGTLIEKFEHMSLIEGAKKFDNSTSYYKDYVNTSSVYIGFGDLSSGALTTGYVELRNGSDGTGEANFQSGFDILNTKNYDFLAFIGQGQTLDKQQGAIDLSLSRRTSVTFVSPLPDVKSATRANRLNLIRDWRNTQLLRDNSYFFMDDNWGEVYDKYNNVRRFIPCCGGTAGLWFRSIAAAGIGKSPAFYNRGKYLGYTRMMWSVNDDERSELYNELGINSIVSEREGIILMGDKTGLSRKSAFSRINTRGVFIGLEISISDTAKYVLGENNDTFTQALFRNSVEPALRRKKESGEILDYRVKCDETNNTGQVLVENKFVAGIYIKPQYSISWVYLDFVALRPDMEFSELEGNYGLVSF